MADDLPDDEMEIMVVSDSESDDDLPDVEIMADNVDTNIQDGNTTHSLNSDSDLEVSSVDDYAEFYSVPRVVPYVRALGGLASISLDLHSPGISSREFLDPLDQYMH